MLADPEDTLPVTVLLPVFNGGRHLSAAVQSILDQTYPDFELLVVDDGSTDGSAQLLDALTDPRVRVIHQDNQGLVSALNTGLAQAKHPLVARMDADDMSLPRRLELQVTHLRAHPEVAAVGCCFEVIDEALETVRYVHTAGSSAYQKRRLYFRNVLAHSGMTFRRDAVLDVGGYRDVGPAEDYDLWARLAVRYEIESLPQTLLRYRDNPAGISAAASDRQRQVTREIRRRLHDEHPLSGVTPGGIFAEGLQHEAAFSRTCTSPAATYVFDHLWLTIVLARQRRWRMSVLTAVGTVALMVRRPRSTAGLLAIFRRR